MKKSLENLQWRYAVKKFDVAKKVSQEDLQELIDAFILTPSSLGLQPWKLIYIENIEKRKLMAPFCWNDSQILESTGVFVLARTTDISDNLVDKFINFIIQKTGTPKEDLKDYEDMMKKYLSTLNNIEKQAWADRQVMIALGNLINVCAEKRIDSCPIEGFDKNKIDEILELREKKLSSVVLLPIGYRDINDTHLQRGKIRYDEHMVFEKI